MIGPLYHSLAGFIIWTQKIPSDGGSFGVDFLKNSVDLCLPREFHNELILLDEFLFL